MSEPRPRLRSTPPAEPGEVTARLDGIRERHALVTGPESGNWGRLDDLHAASYQLSHEDAGCLLAAVEAVRALTRDPEGDLPGECAVSVDQIREAISAGLLGEGDVSATQESENKP